MGLGLQFGVIEVSTDIQSVLSQAKPDTQHGWTLTTAQLADGYGVSPTTLRGNKRNNDDELKEGHHWFKDDLGHTHWTKAGAVRMGMFVKSDRAIQFRDMAEALVVGAMESSVQILNAPALPTSPALPQLDATAEAIADVVVSQLSAEQMLSERVNHHVQQKLDRQVQSIDPEALGKGLAAQWGISNLAAMTEAIANLTNVQATVEVNAQ